MDVFHTLQAYLASYGYLAVFVIVGLESAGVPMPGETVLVAAAILAGQGKMQIVGVVGAAAGGAILGDNCGYWIGREFGFPIAYRWGGWVRLDERRLKLGQYLFLRHGGKIVFFGRFVAFLRAFAAFLAGVNHFDWERFFLCNAAGGLVWASIFGAGGFWLGRAFEAYAKPVGLAALAAAVVAFVVGGRFVRHHERQLEDEAERAFPGPLVRPKPPRR
ncbi:membrane protein DedA with SNARE-associated domain [Roseiarcus fermentans]|uniref:Membrane protein DedA with SNARE-associated domain n=1 Tax=Roseiarcus fermentans TaxID=1473586 RepID=A0A366FB60_9HYPH|nr:DedA family protein [Roseiarcus fermentans]RBP11914.1 membrane protein DedA with SNARE-associated domain [Roseiarcus fermentans]